MSDQGKAGLGSGFDTFDRDGVHGAHSPSFSLDELYRSWGTREDRTDEVSVACRDLFDAHARYASIAHESAEDDLRFIDLQAIDDARAGRWEAFKRLRQFRALSTSSVRAKLAVVVLLSTWFGFESNEALEFASEVAKEAALFLGSEQPPIENGLSITQASKGARQNWFDWFSLSGLRESSRRSHN